MSHGLGNGHVTRNRGVLVEIESSCGTDPTQQEPPTTSGAGLEIEPLQADTVERETIRPYFGNYDILLVNQRVQLTIEVELAGSVLLALHRLGSTMRSCGNRGHCG